MDATPEGLRRLWSLGHFGAFRFLNYTVVMTKVDKQKFDDLLRRMLRAKPAPKSSLKTSRKNKAGKIISNPQNGTSTSEINS